jgi:hypothetical protein
MVELLAVVALVVAARVEIVVLSQVLRVRLIQAAEAEAAEAIQEQTVVTAAPVS